MANGFPEREAAPGLGSSVVSPWCLEGILLPCCGRLRVADSPLFYRGSRGKGTHAEARAGLTSQARQVPEPVLNSLGALLAPHTDRLTLVWCFDLSEFHLEK